MFYYDNYHNFTCLKVAALFLIYICLNGIAQTTCSYNLNIRTAVFNLDVTLRDYYCLISESGCFAYYTVSIPHCSQIAGKPDLAERDDAARRGALAERAVDRERDGQVCGQ